MKSITIELTGAGATVHLVLPKHVDFAQAVIVTDDDVEIRVSSVVPAMPSKPKVPAVTTSAKKVTPATSSTSKLPPVPTSENDSKVELAAILARLVKLKPRKRVTAINSIKAIFQLTKPITDDAANAIFEALERNGSITVDVNGRLQYS